MTASTRGAMLTSYGLLERSRQDADTLLPATERFGGDPREPRSDADLHGQRPGARVCALLSSVPAVNSGANDVTTRSAQHTLGRSPGLSGAGRIAVVDTPLALRPVLYVEDHPVNVVLMQSLFEHLPERRLLVAGSLAEAESLMRTQDVPCALLLLDIGLPDGRGTHLLRRLRKLPSCSAAPAVAVTAEYGFDIETTGFDELWEKPLDLQRVLRRLQQLLCVDANPTM